MQSSSRFLLLALALSTPATSALAQSKAAEKVLPALPPPPSSASLVTSGPRGEQFILGPDDVISLAVANHPEMSSDGLTLSSTGRVALPVLGPLTIKGKTLEQARAAIATAYKSQLREPKVSITLVRARPRQATILGAVARPGAVDLQPGWRVSEVLASAGGLNALEPEEVSATLKRLSGPVVPLDIATIYRAPENLANPRVAVGDVISVVPIPLVNVTINGDVGTPGPQSSRRAPHLLAALGRAGDLKMAPEDTDITLLRGGDISALDVAAAAADPTGPENVELRDGDLLSVQGVRIKVNVLSDTNLVKSAGLYTLEGRSTLMRAISAAGGLVGSAGRISASVRRGNQVIPVDLARAVYDPQADIALQSGDIISIRPIDGPRVRLAGEVKTPDKYSFKEGAKVLDAVLEAGGLNLPPAATRISILRTLDTGQQIPLQVDAGLLWRGNDISQNVTLKDGDVILVNAIGTRSVAVLGQIEKPGTYEIRPGDGLTEVLLNAGGPNKLAAMGRVTIDRKDGKTQVVDYSDFGNEKLADVKIEDGDRVRVPVNPRQVLVMDAVEKPGYYGIPEGENLTLIEAINQAGGVLEGAKTNEIVLLRTVPISPKAPEGYTAQRIKMDDIGKGKVLNTINVTLQPGDVIYVPRGKVTQSGLQKAVGALGVFNIVRGIGGF